MACCGWPKGHTFWNPFKEPVEDLDMAGHLLAQPLLARFSEDPFRNKHIASIGFPTLGTFFLSHWLHMNQC